MTLTRDATEIEFTKIAVKHGGITLAYCFDTIPEENLAENQDFIEVELKGFAPALDSFHFAWSDLKQDMALICGYPDNLESEFYLNEVIFIREDGIKKVYFKGEKTLIDATKTLKLVTPPRPMEQSSQEITPGVKTFGLLPEATIKRLDNLIVEAGKYFEGERRHTQLNLSMEGA